MTNAPIGSHIRPFGPRLIALIGKVREHCGLAEERASKMPGFGSSLSHHYSNLPAALYLQSMISALSFLLLPLGLLLAEMPPQLKMEF